MNELFNFYGLAFAILLALPHILYRRRHPTDPGGCPNKGMVILDRMGRLGVLLLMSVHIGVLEKGFTEPKELMMRFWLILTSALVILYWALWLLFFRRSSRWLANLIVAVSAAAAIMSGILQVNTLLVSFGIVYLIGELYIVKCVIPK